jgi:GT2 family glycosyltransferase
MRDESIGAAQPKLMCFLDKGMIDNTGGILDWYGYAHGRGHFENDSGRYDKIDEVFYAGATAMVVRASVLRETGVMDSEYVIYAEDVDLSWRIRLRGYRIVYIPKAIVYHRGSQTIYKNPGKINVAFLSRKNRISTLIKNYSVFNLCRFLPVVMGMYISVFVKEIFIERSLSLAMTSMRALWWNLRELPTLLKKRAEVQKHVRKLSDSHVLALMYPRCIFLEQYVVPFLLKKKGA